ncbi:MAG TPA: hypothetical protein VII12_05020 [Thermoanaerobaculia bacterium]
MAGQDARRLRPGRPLSSVRESPATGSHHRHEEQQKALIDAALG